MAKEEQTTNADSFATLSEASFAEDWDSKEDRVYDEQDAKLLALLKAASPGRWKAQRDNAGRMLLSVYDDELQDWRELGEFYLHPLRRDADRANARLAALAPGLAVALRLARALRAKTHNGRQVGATHPTPCDDCKVLADWDRVLKGLSDG